MSRLAVEAAEEAAGEGGKLVRTKTTAEDMAARTLSWAMNLMQARMKMQGKYLEQMYDLYEEDFHLCAMPLLTSEVRGKELLTQFAGRLSTSEWRPRLE